MDVLSKWNVARKYEKRTLLILINAVAGLSIFFFGYDQGVMGGVNGTRDYEKFMAWGHFDEALGIVVPDNALKQGGIVSIAFDTRFLFSLLTCIGCCLLPSRNSLRRVPWGLVWRQIWAYQDDRRGVTCSHCRRYSSMLCPKRQLDVLW